MKWTSLWGKFLTPTLSFFEATFCEMIQNSLSPTLVPRSSCCRKTQDCRPSESDRHDSIFLSASSSNTWIIEAEPTITQTDGRSRRLLRSIFDQRGRHAFWIWWKWIVMHPSSRRSTWSISRTSRCGTSDILVSKRFNGFFNQRCDPHESWVKRPNADR
jgi:hypothetical protein